MYKFFSFTAIGACTALLFFVASHVALAGTPSLDFHGAGTYLSLDDDDNVAYIGEGFKVSITGADPNQPASFLWTNSSGKYTYAGDFGSTDSSGRLTVSSAPDDSWTPGNLYGAVAIVNGKMSDEIKFTVNPRRSTAFSIGDSIRVKRTTGLRTVPNEGVISSDVAKGTIGKIETMKNWAKPYQPVYAGGKWWWFVVFYNGEARNWVVEDDIEETREEPSKYPKVGDLVEVMQAYDSSTVGVWSSIGGAWKGTQPVRAQGCVTAGPEHRRSDDWFKIDFAQDPDGWAKLVDIKVIDGPCPTTATQMPTSTPSLISSLPLDAPATLSKPPTSKSSTIQSKTSVSIGCDDSIGPSLVGCGEDVIGTDTLIPVTYPYDYKLVRGREILPPLTREPRFSEIADSARNATVEILNAPSSVQPGEKRTINVKVKNTGTATWVAGPSNNRNYYLVISPQVEMQVDWGVYNFRDTTNYLTQDLAPNQEAVIPFTITAPVTGRYALRVRLLGKEAGVLTSFRYIGKHSNEAIITVGDPQNASLSCPVDATVIDQNKQLRLRGFFSHHAMHDANITLNNPKKYCFVIDAALPGGRLEFYATDGTDNTQWGYSMKVEPPPGSGLQILPSANPVFGDNRAQYTVRRGTFYNFQPAPVPGNYIVTVKSSYDSFAYVSSLGEADGYVEELPLRGTITGQTTDKNGVGVRAYVYVSKVDSDVYAPFITRLGNNYIYQFPNLIRTGKSDYAWAGQYKVSAKKPGYTSEYRINNGLWQQGSSVNIDVPIGTVDVDWRFMQVGDGGEAQSLAIGKRIRIRQSNSIANVNVRKDPTGIAFKYGEQLNGALGTVLEGPVDDPKIVTRKWWKIDFDAVDEENVDGWVIESRIKVDPTAVSVPPSPMVLSEPLTIGDRVEVRYVKSHNNALAVYQKPFFFDQTSPIVGFQEKGAKGIIIEGPRKGSSGGKAFWKVNFDKRADLSDFDGWVLEAALKKINELLSDDANPPMVSIKAPVGNGGVYNTTERSVVVNAFIADDDTGVQETTAHWARTVAGSIVASGKMIKTAYGWIAQESAVSSGISISEGTNTIEIGVKDMVGNVASSTITIINMSQVFERKIGACVRVNSNNTLDAANVRGPKNVDGMCGAKLAEQVVGSTGVIVGDVEKCTIGTVTRPFWKVDFTGQNAVDGWVAAGRLEPIACPSIGTSSALSPMANTLEALRQSLETLQRALGE